MPLFHLPIKLLSDSVFVYISDLTLFEKADFPIYRVCSILYTKHITDTGNGWFSSPYVCLLPLGLCETWIWICLFVVQWIGKPRPLSTPGENCLFGCLLFPHIGSELVTFWWQNIPSVDHQQAMDGTT